MTKEQKQQEDSDHERSKPGHEDERPQTWKHPDDGKELSERDEERPLKP